MELRAGDFVTSGVRLVRPLAEGGMGRVWIASHAGLQCDVVVKLMAKEMIARADGAERFAREAAAAAAIKSPNVVQVFDHGVTIPGGLPGGSEHEVPYIVMELLEGKDLGEVLRERGRLEPDEVIQVVMQVGKALAKAHKVGIIHRDIKPENIFLCDGEAPQTIKLLDFGTVKSTASPGATLPGEIMGTPYYMSPEQSVGAIVDERTDIWSLGVVAFEALTGTRPFEGPNVGAIALAIHGPLPKVSARTADLPPALDEWFARACAQVPQDRFASMREMTVNFIETLTGIMPMSEPTESICLPVRKISVRPAPIDELRKTVPTAMGPSVPPPANALPPSPIPPATSTTVRPERLVDTLPDRSIMHRPTKVALGVVGAIAAGAMALIVLHKDPAPAAAAAPPPAVTALPQVAVTQEPPPPAPPPVVEPPPAPTHHAHASTHAPKKTAKPATTPATPKKDDDLAALMKAGDKAAEPPPAPVSPKPAETPPATPEPNAH
jgi:serine/threonine-protein kinase